MNSTLTPPAKVELFQRTDVVDTLTKLGWERSHLAYPTGYRRELPNYKISNTVAKDLKVGFPKDWRSKSDPRFVLDCEVGDVDRLIVRTDRRGWERQVYLWHAKATFAIAKYQAEVAADAAQIQENARQEAAALAAAFPGFTREEVTKFTSAYWNEQDGITANINFDSDRNPINVFKTRPVANAKVLALLTFLKAEGWFA
jgi:hypothetical protein